MYRFISVLFIVFALVFLNGCKMSNDTVAKIGNSKITKEAFKQALSQRYRGKKTFTSVDSSAKMAILNRLIDRDLKVNAAKDLGLENTDEFKADYMNKEGRILNYKYYEHVVVDKLFPEKMLHDNYEKQREQVDASHILIAYKGSRGSKVSRTKDEAKALAAKIAKEAKNGGNFEELAQKYSDDPSVKRNKGNMGFFTWGQMVGAFQKAAFSMKPGDISNPVETVYGFHIIKVNSRRPNPNFKENNFEAQKMNLKVELYRAHKDTAMAIWNKHMAKLKEDSHYRVLNKNLEKVITLYNGKKKAGRVKADDFSADEKNIVLAEWDGGKLTLKKVFNFFYGPHFSALSQRLNNVGSLEALVGNISNQMLVVADAKRMGIDKEEEVAAQLTNAANQKLSLMAENEEVRKKIVLNDDELQKYYQQHVKEFMRPAEIEIWEIFVKDKKKADRIARLAKAGRNFKKLAAKYTEDKYYKKQNGYLGYRQERRRGTVSQKAFEVGPNKIAGPVKYRNGWAVIKTGKLKPETQRSFEEARSQVRTKLYNQKLGERRAEWEKELHKKYSVKINYPVVKSI